MESIMDLYFCTQNLVTTQKYFAVPILTEVARSASCSGVKGVIPARVDRVRPGLSISSIFSDVFRHLPSCQALPRAPLSGHRGSELWDGKDGIWSFGPRWKIQIWFLSPSSLSNTESWILNRDWGRNNNLSAKNVDVFLIRLTLQPPTTNRQF